MLGSSKSPFISHFHLEVGESSFCPGLHDLGPPSRLQSEFMISLWCPTWGIRYQKCVLMGAWALSFTLGSTHPTALFTLMWSPFLICRVFPYYLSIIIRPKLHLIVYICVCVCVCVCVHKCTHREHSISSDAKQSHSYFLGKGETAFWNRILSRLVPLHVWSLNWPWVICIKVTLWDGLAFGSLRVSSHQFLFLRTNYYLH